MHLHTPTNSKLNLIEQAYLASLSLGAYEAANFDGEVWFQMEPVDDRHAAAAWLPPSEMRLCA